MRGLARLLDRGPGLPVEVRAAVPGRPLAAALAEDGTWLVGTRDRLAVVGAGPAVTLGWESVQRADWDADTSTLRVEEVGGPPAAFSAYTLAEPGALLALVRERVTASIVVQRRYAIERRRGVTVVGRRPPSGRGPVTWSTQLDAGLDPDDAEVLAAVQAALREVRESVGL